MGAKEHSSRSSSPGADVTATVTVPAQDAAFKRVREHVETFASPQDARGARLVFMTFALWFGSFALGGWLFKHVPLTTWWGVAAVAFWGAVRIGTVTRALIVLHDANHSILFKRRWVNYWTAITTGLLVGVDAPDFHKTHMQHHAVLGIEEEANRDPDVTILFKVPQWKAWRRGPIKAILRVMSDPIGFFLVFGPPILLTINVGWPHRVAHQSLLKRCAYVASRVVLLPCLFGTWLYLATTCRAHVVAELLALHFGFGYTLFLYCVEHVFEGAYRVPRAEFNRTAAATQGSSYLPMPKWWQWVTLGCEYHHIHHANTRVPLYRMAECHHAAPPGMWDAAGLRPLTTADGFRAMIQSLWDPDQRCYVPWPEWEWLDRLLASKSAPPPPACEAKKLA